MNCPANLASVPGIFFTIIVILNNVCGTTLCKVITYKALKDFDAKRGCHIGSLKPREPVTNTNQYCFSSPQTL